MQRAGVTGLALVASAALGACVAPPAVTPIAPAPDACGAAALQYLVGQPRQAIGGMTFHQPLRIIEPGQAVTMDFNAQRLNIELDGNGRISRIACG